MDRRERYDDPEEVQRIAFEGGQSRLWTALPGIISAFDATKHTVSVQPTIKGIVRQLDGTLSELQLPLLLDCPVVFPGGGGVTLTFPIKAGDECLVVFASRCIDSWWQLGGVQGQAELRMHDLSDGFCIPGGRSQPRAFTARTDVARLTADNGNGYVEIDPDTGNMSIASFGALFIYSQNKANITAPNGIAITGNVKITGNLQVTGTTIGNGVNLNTHVHSGVQTGSGNSGTPV